MCLQSKAEEQLRAKQSAEQKVEDLRRQLAQAEVRFATGSAVPT